ncbi:SMP-30/gluconolactonase/LRE family protein [Jannaschia sp. S6380]|uniref:SMP-30/gluconolactonase/LRE family protein n=1 Tax=Jannaschia sp. S6380 TaxID=2926408 RepID=UPI001FF4EC9D|nr:SMP-30/gluconolactonase/LRE family protein [Jannaschia sp. S6380]MCK0168279.1 SMP-30/gluconolactonase/LRE family protein [Jannaschia sp. S6380]
MDWASSHDPRFDSFVLGNAPLKRLATGFDWVEGPVWFGDADCLLFSDIPNDRILRWSAETGISIYRKPSNFANGNTRDRQGRLITCEHRGRRVTRTEPDGTVTVIADAFDGKPLNSPNDVVVKSDGTIWFSDPHYGIAMDYEGARAEQENPCVVYRVDPATGDIRVVVDDLNCPNGLAFSPDERLLYVADTGRIFTDDRKHMRVYDVTDGGTANGRDFVELDAGFSDGFRLDEDGNVWSSAGDGVHCIAPDGTVLGRIHVPETVSNVCFGGRSRHVLFITATTSVYSIALNRRGARTV